MYDESTPRVPVAGRIKVAPAPSPNSTAVVRSVQSMILVSFSAAMTSMCLPCPDAMSPSATLSAYTNPAHAAPTSKAAAFLAPSTACRSHAADGSSRSGEAVAYTIASTSSGVRAFCSSTCSAAALPMQALVSSLLETRRSRIPVRSRIHWSERSEEHTSELQSLRHLVCRLLLEKKKRLARTPDRPMLLPALSAHPS